MSFIIKVFENPSKNPTVKIVTPEYKHDRENRVIICGITNPNPPDFFIEKKRIVYRATDFVIIAHITKES